MNKLIISAEKFSPQYFFETIPCIWGKISVYATGFSTVPGVLFDKAGGLYVLEDCMFPIGDLAVRRVWARY